MSITTTERRVGRRPSGGDSPSNEVPLLVLASAGEDEEAVLTYLEGAAPGTLGGLVFKSARVDEVIKPGEMYLASLSYGSASDSSSKEAGDSTYSFDTSGGSFRITQSKATRNRYPASDAPDLKGAIGVDEEGNVEGTDIVIPQFAFSETHYVADGDVDDTYKGVLYAMTGKTNDGTFRGLLAGECLFLGAKGTQRAKGDWEITFDFGGSPNVTGLTIGDVTSIAKKGWDYLWVRYVKATGGTGANKVLIPKAKHVYVERVYDEGDFDLLGI